MREKVSKARRWVVKIGSALLTADGKGVYRLMLDKPLTGKWHVRVDAFNHEWRLQETAQLPTQAAIELDPKGR